MSPSTASPDAPARTSGIHHQHDRLEIPQARSPAQAEVHSFGERAIGASHGSKFSG